MFTEQGPQPIYLDPNCTADLLILVVVTHTLGLGPSREGKWLGFGSAQVSCYPWGCGYTVKDTPQGKIQLDIS